MRRPCTVIIPAPWRSNPMQTLIENLINGNNTTAREQAKRFTHWQLRDALEDAGYSLKKATLTADWLKGREGVWQAACDAE